MSTDARLKAAKSYPLVGWTKCDCWRCRFKERLRLLRVRRARKHAPRWVRLP